MTITKDLKTIFNIKDVVPAPTCGILVVVLLSCILFFIQAYLNLTQGILSIGATVFESGHIHRLFLYPLYHKTLAQLLLNITVMLFLCSSVEKGVGTVRFMFLFLLLSSTTGMIYSFLDLLQDVGMHNHTEGLLPVTLACVALTTMHTKMTKAFLCGVSFPTMALPWLLLIICSALIPHSVLPCNIIGTLIGWAHGKGWLSLIDLSEARAGVLEKMMLFRLLRSISGVMFIPASTEERRKTLLPQINPTPGSYPVQAYAPLSSINTANTTATKYEGWPNSVDSLPSYLPPPNPSAHSFGHTHGHYSEQSFGHSCNHNHSHSHGQQ
ncbi:rhomboid domain-containing protein 2 [Melanotaenia boesemani]|uniref:rhomboid domain-containing protein 2 n=1 Tax=Melanotaenia boesemani TaxID=1250792 RepID=UPI001C03B3B3|nr:rhomboid domain-containing protein 2 [Melanotaenia boesemani]